MGEGEVRGANTCHCKSMDACGASCLLVMWRREFLASERPRLRDMCARHTRAWAVADTGLAPCKPRWTAK
eukprot:6812766-Prymnesium_polylepis.2